LTKRAGYLLNCFFDNDLGRAEIFSAGLFRAFCIGHSYVPCERANTKRSGHDITLS
jgi:hypothetical protein